MRIRHMKVDENCGQNGREVYTWKSFERVNLIIKQLIKDEEAELSHSVISLYTENENRELMKQKEQTQFLSQII